MENSDEAVHGGLWLIVVVVVRLEFFFFFFTRVFDAFGWVTWSSWSG
jgi:hypothetical protein